MRDPRALRLRLGAVAMAMTTASCGALTLALDASSADSGQASIKDFDPGRFSTPTRIDNRFTPLVPGTQFILVGRANRGEGRRAHRVVFTVTDLTKVIDGVRTRVLWDRDFNAGALNETELTFHAQDDAGNLWNLGEYPEEHAHGRVTAPDTWIAGLDGARAGILMRATPRTRASSYLQGFAPAIEFADRARVVRTGQRTCVPRRCYRDVLVTDEWNPAEPGARQLKFYAPGVGNIRVGAAGRDKEDETLVLDEVRHLSPGAMIHARREALALERRAYRIRADVYGRTPPSEREAPEVAR